MARNLEGLVALNRELLLGKRVISGLDLDENPAHQVHVTGHGDTPPALLPSDGPPNGGGGWSISSRAEGLPRKRHAGEAVATPLLRFSCESVILHILSQ